MRIGVAGIGYLGKIHTKLLSELEEFELVGCFDIDQEALKTVANTYNIINYKSYAQMLENVDAVDIVTPTLSHYEYASEAIKRGKHVFIEKPVTQNSKQAQTLCKLELEHGVKVQIGHVERFNPAFIAARPLVKNPMFIETHRLAEFNPRGTDVPVVLDLMIHDLDIVLNLVNAPVKQLSASGVKVLSESIDIASVRIEFDNGCVSNLTTSRISLKNMRKTRIFQDESYLMIDFLNKKTEIINIQEVIKEDPFAITIDTAKGEKKQIIFNSPKISEINSIKEELRTFYYSIVKNTPIVVTLEQGTKALKLAEDIIEEIQMRLDSI